MEKVKIQTLQGLKQYNNAFCAGVSEPLTTEPVVEQVERVEQDVSVAEKPVVKQTTRPKITKALRDQMLRDSQRWDELEGKVRTEDANRRVYEPKANKDYVPSEEEIQYWMRIFDGDETLFLTDLIDRMLFEELLNKNPQNATKMMNKLFRAAYNKVLIQQKGQLYHEYKLKEAK